MRNTIELNGISSNDITGLLIQELPSISKPLIRTEVELIDGRDGDIITKLGYSAYDKEILIGLYGNYDINEVIAFFNSEGIVTFSNEPDKFYIYEILDKIDFERLVRFRTAKVKFHVQPFKYSTEEVERTFDINPNLLSIPDFTQTTNGVTVTVADGNISVSGTASAATEFYVPTGGLNLDPGSYTLTADANGTGETAVSIRLIGSAPSNADSFGGNYVTLANDDEVTLNDTLNAAKTFGYLWFYVNAGTALDISLMVSVKGSNPVQSVSITNSGNIYARPQIILTGSGTLNLSLNEEQLFVINFGEGENTIMIDTAALEATYEETGLLANRAVDGDYDNFKLPPGENTISWSGDLSKLTIDNYSRWL